MDLGKTIVHEGIRKFIVSWEGIAIASSKLAAAIAQHHSVSKCAYVARGGRIPCEHVMSKLGIENLNLSVKISGYKEGIEYPKASELEIPADLKGLDGRGIVFIDDIAGDGTTARLVKHYFPNALFGACLSWPAALTENYNGRPLIDFLGMSVEKIWVVFPWETEWEKLNRL